MHQAESVSNDVAYLRFSFLSGPKTDGMEGAKWMQKKHINISINVSQMTLVLPTFVLLPAQF